MLIDMPFEELKTYTGRNPRPADFDSYWDRALTEMRSVDPKVELVPHDIGAGEGCGGDGRTQGREEASSLHG